jgi:putative transposase
MTTFFTIDRSLIIRIGSILYQFHRQLDSGQTLQFENQMTGELKIFKCSEFYRNVETGIIIPVTGTDVNHAEKTASKIVDIRVLDEKTRDELYFKLSIIKFIRKLKIKRGQRERISEAIKVYFSKFGLGKESPKILNKIKVPSTSTVMDWMRKFEESGKNVVSLISGNLFRKRKSNVHHLTETAITTVLDKYYLNLHRPSLDYAYQKLEHELNDIAKRESIEYKKLEVSFATFQRRKESLDPFMVKTRRKGFVAASHDFRVTMEGTTVTRAMQRYEIDHTLLNWVVVSDLNGIPLGRPTLTIVIDSYSGYTTGLYVSFNGPGLTSVINVLKSAIRPKDDVIAAIEGKNPWIASGIPDSLMLDNGMEFHSKIFKNITFDLGTDIEYARVRTPWLKPKVERFFANLDYLTLVEGRVYKPILNVLRIDPDKTAAITLSALCKGLILYACDVHARTPNSRTLELPFDRFAQSIAKYPPASLPTSLATLDMIAAMSKKAMVSHGGVELLGLGYAGYPLKELIHSAGGKFSAPIKWDPDNMNQIFVQHSRTNEWVCLPSTRPEYTNGLTFNQHRIIRDFARKTLKSDGIRLQLNEAKLRLCEAWLNPIAMKNKTTETSTAKKLAGSIISQSLAFDTNTPANSSTSSILITEDDLMLDTNEIPSFDTYKL